METSRLTAKGQITIPKTLRECLGLHSADEVEFVELEGGIRVQKRVPASPFTRYRGYLRHRKGQDSDALLEGMRGR
jgi:AbrB family looped-hinge helix DNA binding protein